MRGARSVMRVTKALFSVRQGLQFPEWMSTNQT
jgi:hypothetical protein